MLDRIPMKRRNLVVQSPNQNLQLPRRICDLSGLGNSAFYRITTVFVLLALIYMSACQGNLSLAFSNNLYKS